MLALDPVVLLLVQLWCMANPSVSGPSSHYQQKTRKTDKGKYFPDILVICCLPQSWRSARVKVREGQGCTARTGEVRPSRSRELLNHLSHLPKSLLDDEVCSIPPSWVLSCRLGFSTCCQVPRAQLCSSSHH